MAKQCGGRDVGALRGVRPVAGARRLGGLVDGLWGALLPVQCAGCLAWDEVLCPSCRSLAAAPALPTAVDGARGPIPGVVLGDYSGPLRRIVLAAKHAARTDVSDFLDEAGAALGASLREVVAPVGSPPGRVGGVTGRVCAAGEAVTVWVVPAPSSWRRRLRGRSVALPLARGVARGLASAAPGVRACVVDALALRVGAGSQSGKAGAARVVGRMGSMRPRAEVPVGVLVVAVDDVVTTGATIREMERVLGRLDGVAALCRPGLIS